MGRMDFSSVHWLTHQSTIWYTYASLCHLKGSRFSSETWISCAVTARMKQIRKVGKNVIVLVSKAQVQRRTAKTVFVTDLIKYIGASQKRRLKRDKISPSTCLRDNYQRSNVIWFNRYGDYKDIAKPPWKHQMTCIHQRLLNCLSIFSGSISSQGHATSPCWSHFPLGIALHWHTDHPDQDPCWVKKLQLLTITATSITKIQTEQAK